MNNRLIATLLVEKFYSIIFRILLIVFSIYILLVNGLYFNFSVYLLCLLIYVVNYIFLLFNGDEQGKLRLVNDYSLITFILLGQDIYLISNFIFFAIPLVNSSNHSERKNNLFFFLFVTTVSLIFISFFNTFFDKITLLLFPLGMIYLISIITSARKRSERKLVNQFNKIENSLNKILTFPKSYMLYTEILEEIKKLKFFNLNFNIYKDIACFNIKEIGSVHLVNSSLFIYEYGTIKKERLKDFDLDSEKTEYIEAFSVKFNDIEYTNSLVIKVKSKKIYLFILTNKEENTSVQNLYVFNVLKPIFERLARVIEFELNFNYEKRKNLVDIKSKFLYIRNAETAMHFIKNKLSPLANLIEVFGDLLEKNVLFPNDPALHRFVKTENDKSKNSVSKIIGQADLILDKSENPFNFSQLHLYEIHKVVTVTKELADEFLLTNYNITFNLDYLSIDRYELKYNPEGFYLLITDWFANMKKYGTNHEVYFSENSDYFLLIFANEFDETQIIKVGTLVREFNDNKRNEIIRRKSHGLFQIKTSLEQMELIGKMSIISKNELSFEIKFKKHGIENI